MTNNACASAPPQGHKKMFKIIGNSQNRVQLFVLSYCDRMLHAKCDFVLLSGFVYKMPPLEQDSSHDFESHDEHKIKCLLYFIGSLKGQ